MSITQVEHFIAKLIEKRRTATPEQQNEINTDLNGFYNLKMQMLKNKKGRS